MISSASFSWRAFQLYRGHTATGFSVVPDLQDPRMWRLHHRSGFQSGPLNYNRVRNVALSLVQQGIGQPRRSPPKRRDPQTANRKTVH
jgi:hypothetical protein